MAAYPLKERTAWRRWVTATGLAGRPIHRWYVFPHSFTAELVHALIDEWGLGPGDHILDPFVGAGTTVLAARERGIPATGYDLSPLAVLAARTKVAALDPARLCALGTVLLGSEAAMGPAAEPRGDYPELVKRALPGGLLERFADPPTRTATTTPGCSGWNSGLRSWTGRARGPCATRVSTRTPKHDRRDLALPGTGRPLP